MRLCDNAYTNNAPVSSGLRWNPFCAAVGELEVLSCLNRRELESSVLEQTPLIRSGTGGSRFLHDWDESATIFSVFLHLVSRPDSTLIR